MDYSTISVALRRIIEAYGNSPVMGSEIRAGGLTSDLSGVEFTSTLNSLGLSDNLREFSIEMASDSASFEYPGIFRVHPKLPRLEMNILEELADMRIAVSVGDSPIIHLDSFFEFMNSKVSLSLLTEALTIGNKYKLSKTGFFKLVLKHGNIRNSEVHMYSLLKYLGILTEKDEIFINQCEGWLECSYELDYSVIKNILQRTGLSDSSHNQSENKKDIEIIAKQGLNIEVLGSVSESTLARIRELIKNDVYGISKDAEFNKTSLFIR